MTWDRFWSAQSWPIGLSFSKEFLELPLHGASAHFLRANKGLGSTNRVVVQIIVNWAHCFVLPFFKFAQVWFRVGGDWYFGAVTVRWFLHSIPYIHRPSKVWLVAPALPLRQLWSDERRIHCDGWRRPVRRYLARSCTWPQRTFAGRDYLGAYDLQD